MNPVTILIIGGGGRGSGYSTYATEHPDLAKVVGVAEPREFYRNRLVETHDIPSENVFTDWKQAAKGDFRLRPGGSGGQGRH